MAVSQPIPVQVLGSWYAVVSSISSSATHSLHTSHVNQNQLNLTIYEKKQSSATASAVDSCAVVCLPNRLTITVHSFHLIAFDGRVSKHVFPLSRSSRFWKTSVTDRSGTPGTHEIKSSVTVHYTQRYVWFDVLSVLEPRHVGIADIDLYRNQESLPCTTAVYGQCADHGCRCCDIFVDD